MKIYIPNLQDNLKKIGGGFRFIQNLHKGLKDKVEFVDNWIKCDIVFIFGITTIDKTDIHNAINAGKKLILRIDNIPRRSRNKRQSPIQRLQEFGNKSDMIIYQSKWCKEYVGYFIDNDNNCIINNGVDTSIFNCRGRNSDGKTYLYINYNDNPNKRFDEALYWFDMKWREAPQSKLYIAGNVPNIYLEHPEYNWDIPTNGKIEYKGIMNSPEQVANLMKQCDYILCPYFAEGYSNVLLEAMACGLEPFAINETGGNIEVVVNSLDKVKSLDEMCNEYLEIFENIINKKYDK